MDLDLFLLLLVLLGMSLGVLDHTIDFVVGKRGGAVNGDLLLLAGTLVLSGDLDDAVGVDIPRYAAAKQTIKPIINARFVFLIFCYLKNCTFLSITVFLRKSYLNLFEMAGALQTSPCNLWGI